MLFFHLLFPQKIGDEQRDAGSHPGGGIGECDAEKPGTFGSEQDDGETARHLDDAAEHGDESPI